MHRLFIITFCVLFLCTSVASMAHALGLAENIQLHGFASQGYIRSHNNNFLVHSRSGSIKMTDAGLNLNWRPFQSLRIGAQGYYRNLGDYNENRVVLDWGVVDYQPWDIFGIRAGKIKMPLGLYNEVRDSPFLLPMVFLPQSIYDESRRDSNLAYIGLGVYGNLPCGPYGDVDYHLFTGQTDVPDESQLEQNNENSAIAAINRNNTLPAEKKNPLLPSRYQSLDRESDDLYGGAVVYNTPLGLRLSFTLLHSKASIYLNGSSQSAGNTLVHNRFVFSAEYTTDQWLIASEYSETDRTTTMFGSTTLDGPTQSWYVMVCYNPFDDWTFSLLYDEFFRMKHDKHSDERPQAEPYTGWRKDIGAGVRYDLNDWCNLKFEYHYVDGTAMQLSVINDDPKRYWSYFAARLSVVF